MSPFIDYLWGGPYLLRGALPSSSSAQPPTNPRNRGLFHATAATKPDCAGAVLGGSGMPKQKKNTFKAPAHLTQHRAAARRSAPPHDDPSLSLKKGGAGESGFYYEAGASVAMVPVEALLTSPLRHQRRWNQRPFLPCFTQERVREEENGEEEQQRFPVVWLRGRKERALSNRSARKRVGEAARVGTARSRQCRRGLGTPER